MAYPSPFEVEDWGSTASAGSSRSPACGCGEYAPVEEPEFESCRSYWSELRSSDVEEDIAEANRKAFRQFRKKWPNGFFQELQWNLESGEKIAEGAQGEIYITHGSVWKVFKLEDASLFLEEQLPLGLYQNYSGVGLKNHYCWVHGARLFRDGRIAFKMWRYWGDLRKLIDLRIHDYFEKLISDLKLHSLVDLKGHLIRCAVLPPFSCSEGYRLMWEIALGMRNLRERNIPHRDLKASNVLIMPSTQSLDHCPRHSDEFSCAVADYECCIGVVGTRFWRAPEILQALKESKPLLFTESSDVYSYAMTCYEILTGKTPFEGLQPNDYEAIYSGKVKLQWPEYTAPQIKVLLQRCTYLQPSMRPTFKEICVRLKNFRDTNSPLDHSVRKSRLQLVGKVEYIDKTSTRDVPNVLESLGVSACYEELEPMIRKVDCDNDGFIHCGELINLIALFKRTLNDEQWSFRVQLAKNGKYFGRTSIADVPKVFWSFGVAACHEELNAIVCKVDSYNDGFINCGELLHLVTLFKRTLNGEEWSFRAQLAKEVEYFERTSNAHVPKVLWLFGVAACHEELEVMLGKVDCDKAGFITCKELIELIMLFERTINGEEWIFREQLAQEVEYFERMSTGNVPKVLWSFGVAACDDELEAMLGKVDCDNDGFITCKELIDLVMIFKRTVNDEEWSFRVQFAREVEYFERMSTGDVSKVLWSFGFAACHEELKAMLGKDDSDKDGFITCKELIDLIMLYKRTLDGDEWRSRVQLAKNGKYFDRTSIADVPKIFWSFGVAACHEELNAMFDDVDHLLDGKFVYRGRLPYLVMVFKGTVNDDEWSVRVQLAKEVEYFERMSTGDIPKVLWSFGVAACGDELRAMLGKVVFRKDGFLTCKQLIDLIMLYKRTLDGDEWSFRVQLAKEVEYFESILIGDIPKVLWSFGFAACDGELEGMLNEGANDKDGFISAKGLIDLIMLYKRSLGVEEWRSRVQLAKNGKYFDRTSIGDVPKLCWSFGFAACHEELNATVCKVRSYKDGFINRGELLDIVTVFMRTVNDEEWNFREQLAMEVEYSERMSTGDISKVLWSLGVAACDDELKAMLGEVDSDKDGFITCKELIDLIMLYKRTLDGDEWRSRVQLAKNGKYFDRTSIADVPKIFWSFGVAACHEELYALFDDVDYLIDGFVYRGRLPYLVMVFKRTINDEEWSFRVQLAKRVEYFEWVSNGDVPKVFWSFGFAAFDGEVELMVNDVVCDKEFLITCTQLIDLVMLFKRILDGEEWSFRVQVAKEVKYFERMSIGDVSKVLWSFGVAACDGELEAMLGKDDCDKDGFITCKELIELIVLFKRKHNLEE